jgi:hypothetical protein
MGLTVKSLDMSVKAEEQNNSVNGSRQRDVPEAKGPVRQIWAEA